MLRLQVATPDSMEEQGLPPCAASNGLSRLLCCGGPPAPLMHFCSESSPGVQVAVPNKGHWQGVLRLQPQSSMLAGGCACWQEGAEIALMMCRCPHLLLARLVATHTAVCAGGSA